VYETGQEGQKINALTVEELEDDDLKTEKKDSL